MTKAIQWLNEYKGNFEFYISLRNYARSTGTLSPKQEAAVLRAIERDENGKNINRTVFAGDKFEIVKSTCERIRKAKKLDVMFRNVEVVQVHDQSMFAVLVSLRLISTVARVCHVCGLGLDNEISRATGIGPVCAKKFGFKRPTISNAQEILAKLSEYANTVGVIEEVWLPHWSYTKTQTVIAETA